MPLRVSGRNISIGAALQQKITDRVEEALRNISVADIQAMRPSGRDGFGFRTECVLHLDSGALLEAEGMAADAYDSARTGRDPHRKAAAPLQTAPQGSSGAPWQPS